MAIKKPKKSKKPETKTAPVKKLMDSQDTVSKGDGVAAAKVPTTILLPADLKEEAVQLAKIQGTTLTRFIVDGLRWRVEQEK